jgi:hypothetical protein
LGEAGIGIERDGRWGAIGSGVSHGQHGGSPAGDGGGGGGEGPIGGSGRGARHPSVGPCFVSLRLAP